MPTLYLRNVPADVIARLERIAAVERVSVSAAAIRELDQVTRRADNPGLLAELPDTGVGVEEIVGGLEDGRTAR